MLTQELIVEKLTTNCSQVLHKYLPTTRLPKIEFNRPTQVGCGDLTTNIAMLTYKMMAGQNPGKFKQPQAWAQELRQKLSATCTGELKKTIASWQVAGSGFINIFLTKKAQLQLWQEAVSFTPPKQHPHPVIVEFSSPNIAKSFTVGHLRSTIIGAAIANLLQSQGYLVKRDNHLGDWGTQFGKQVVAIQHWGNWQQIVKSSHPIADLVALYVRFHQEAKEHPELEDEARLVFTKMEQGDKKYLSLWQKIVDISMKEFNQFYQEMGVSFDENQGRGFGESFFRDKMQVVIAQLREKKLLQKSQGAWIITYPAATKLPPLMIFKQDGATLYATRDLATDYYRLQTYGRYLTIVNEVGKEQSLYFKQIFALEAMLGWFTKEQRIHVAHGLYRFRDRKMSTRQGDVIWLGDIVSQAKNKVRLVCKKSLSDQDVNIIAWGAIKWNDLMREAKNDIDFDLDTMLSLKGNSGAYLQYTCVRLLAVLQKAENKPFEANQLKKLINRGKLADEISKFDECQWGDDELTLIAKMNVYTEAVRVAAKRYAPHILANYLFELATVTNAYYAKQEILGHQQRICLIKAITLFLVTGLTILGIQIPSKM